MHVYRYIAIIIKIDLFRINNEYEAFLSASFCSQREERNTKNNTQIDEYIFYAIGRGNLKQNSIDLRSFAKSKNWFWVSAVGTRRWQAATHKMFNTLLRCFNHIECIECGANAVPLRFEPFTHHATQHTPARLIWVNARAAHSIKRAT